MAINKSILLVEDEALIALNESLSLEKHGFIVEHVASAEKAISSALGREFDLILMDIDLGADRMDGTEAAKEILLKRDVPIVFCTSHTEKEMVERVKDITRYGYVIKNTGEFVLIESIKMALELFNAHCRLKKENSNRIKAEKNYKLAAALYFQMMENSIDAVYLMNWLGEVKEVNNVACTMLGYSKDEFLEMSIDDIDINYPSRRFNEFWDGKPEGATFLFETIHLHKSGRQIPVEINGIFFKNEGEKYLFGVARDISGRERIENQLKENEALLRQIAENYPDSYLSVIESDYSIGFSAGQEFIKAGLEPAQFIGLSLEEVFGDCSEIVRSEYEKTFNGETRSFELFIHNQYQNYRTVPLIDPNGNIKQILSVVQNITERKITEAIFHENHQRYIKAQVLGNVGNWEYNIQTEEFWASDQGKRIYGFKPESENFTPEEVESCIPERIRIHQALLDLISEEKDYNLEFDIITNDTHEKKTIVSIAELEKDAVGIPLKVTGVIHDITEMKKAFHQKEILMKELSHRVKNNLMMVSSLISFTDSDIGKSIDLSGLKSQIDAVMNTYNSLYQTDDITEINFKEYINNLLENVFAQSAMKVKIKVMSELDRIQSAAAVSIGLIINETAINSLKHGFISNLNPVFSVELNQDSVNRKTIIIVSNNGIPIPESVKLENPGTLGLRLISELVNQMEGSIEMQKAPQPVFRIILPSSSVEAAKK